MKIPLNLNYVVIYTFCGEILDFNGEVGGYNLTIAFSTGYTVGISIKK
jgi:predicted flavoprotein YhiN